MKLNLEFPGNKPFDLVGLGLNAIDHLIIVPKFPERNTKSQISGYRRSGGGQIASACSALARLGMKVKYLGKVGNDEVGKQSLETLQREGIDTSDVKIEDSAFSQYAYIIVDESTGERTILWNRHPDLQFRPGDFSRTAITSGRLLHIDGHEALFSIQAVEWAREEGIPVLLDAERIKDGTFDLLPLADIIIADEAFSRKICPDLEYEEILKTIQERFNPVFCAVTLGERGSLGLFRDRFIHVPAYRVDVVDTTGAGDVYHGAFAFGVLKNWKIPDIMRFASAVAGLKCTDYGGRGGIINLEQVINFMGGDYPETNRSIEKE